MHLPLLSRILLLVFQFLILTMALPAARPAPAALAETDEIMERDAAADADKRDSEPPKRGVPFGRRVAINKPASPVRAAVRSPDRLVGGSWKRGMKME
ncbi:hypothetical protein MMC06_005459 [Schaereria dolodes]|nr:hypothetical protein [Schaereria dolodes]